MSQTIKAATAKSISTSYTRTVAEEISLIHFYIIDAADNGLTSVTVGDTTNTTVNGITVSGSPMTSNTVVGQGYYNAWQNAVEDFAKQAEMAVVIKHYQDLGYSITRKSSNSTVFYWTISWH